MEIDLSSIQALVERPGESLSVEIKRWIDPDRPEGIAMIVRAVLALRNHGGGALVSGSGSNRAIGIANLLPAQHESRLLGLRW
jgi:hypothetical protein